MSLLAGARLGPYEILAPLGAGGMGEVYRATDTRVDRAVALKVLPEKFFEDAEMRARFEREARLLASLNHPGIATLYSFEEISGRHVLSMELIEGVELGQRLASGPLPADESLFIARQIAEGLEAAHEKGIVHRDLKPANVRITPSGRVKILDFGLAKQTVAPMTREETSAPTGTVSPGLRASATEPGVVLGTLDYMSPEQVRGRPVDHRSDIFSFGAVLHEMLTGKRAFHRDSVADTMAAITRDEPESAPAVMLDPGLASVVRRCLEKKPEDRYASARDLSSELARVASGLTPGLPTSQAVAAAAPKRRRIVFAGVGAAAAAAIALALFLNHRSPSPAADVRKRIAVLPFENLGSPDQEYFADGVTDEVRGKLTSLASLAVIARGSSTPFKKTTKTQQQIAGELEVAYLLTGTIRWEKSGGSGRVQVTPELVEIKGKGAPESRWQQKIEADLTDVFKVQAEIATRVANELGVALARTDEKRLAERPTANLEAYDAYLKGEEASGSGTRLDPPSLLRAISFHERAVELDPKFAVAWATLSRLRSQLYLNGTPKPELAQGAKEAAERALGLAPERAAGYSAMSLYERNVRADLAKAQEWIVMAQRVEPTALRALAVSSFLNMTAGRWEEAIAEMRESIRIDPLSVRSHRVLGLAFLRRKRHAEAREVYDRAIALAPTNILLYEDRALADLAAGDVEGAKAVIRRASAKVPPAALVAFFANFNDLGWVLDKDQRDLLLRLTPAEFGGDKGAWALCLAQEYRLDGNAERSRALAQEAVAELRRQMAGAPKRSSLHAILGYALALAGEKAAAIAESVRATELVPAENLPDGPYVRHNLARVYVLTGEPEKALDTLEPVLQMPYHLTPAWLKIDPTFDPLRGNPRFQKLVANG